MTVYFANSGKIDLDVIRIMGVSVKANDNPIGYFGTGLKFAIATLLRTGHEITLTRGGEEFAFSARPSTIRGEEVNRVFMNDEALAFTTALGKNWEVWQAYRELHSNTLDEIGQITDQPVEDDTVISVTGDAIQREFINRDKIFIQGKPLAANKYLEVYAGKSTSIYYRGVRAGQVAEPLALTYNILTPMTLTEDRTFASQWDVEYKLAQLIPKLDHLGYLTELVSETDTFDQNLNFSYCSDPSPEFVKAARTVYSNSEANPSVRKVVEEVQQKEASFPPALLDDAAKQKFLDAFAPLSKLACTLSPEDVEVAETLGPNVMGLYHRQTDQIFIAKATLDWGIETIVATLYEEWLHKEYHYRDTSRELQNFLFQRLVALSMGLEAPQPENQKKDFF